MTVMHGGGLEPRAANPDIIEGAPVHLSLLARAARRRHAGAPDVKAVSLTHGKAGARGVYFLTSSGAAASGDASVSLLSKM